MPCSCDRENINSHSNCAAEIRWLDERNSARTAYLARLINGNFAAAIDGSKLAETLTKLHADALASPEKAIGGVAMIQNSDQLHSFLFDNEFDRGHILQTQSQEIKEEFFAKCVFADELSGEGRRRFILTFYFGSLRKKVGMSYEEIFDVAAIFGISEKLFLTTSNRFGQICDDESRGCQPRAYYSCSYKLC